MSNDTQATPVRAPRPLSSRLAPLRLWLSANDDANTYRLCLALFLAGIGLALVDLSSPPTCNAPVMAQGKR